MSSESTYAPSFTDNKPDRRHFEEDENPFEGKCSCLTGPSPNAGSYTIMIGDLCKQKRMKEKGCRSDGRMCNALIKLMTNGQRPDDAVRIYKKIQNDIEPTVHAYNMMLKSFLKTENYDMGLAVWEEMSQKGVCPDENSYTVHRRTCQAGKIKGSP